MSSAQTPSPFIAGRAQKSAGTPGYPPPMTTARRIVEDFLKARVAANNARLTFILNQTPENLRAWVDADAALGDLHDTDYYPVPEPVEDYPVEMEVTC